MSKDKKIYIAAGVLLVAGIYVIWTRIPSSENKWVCENGGWVKHGYPSGAKPETPCKGSETSDGVNNVKADKKELTAEEKAQWDRIAGFIRDCGVKEVTQNHNREVTITLKNTLKQKGIEPQMDDIIKVATEAEGKCGKVKALTE